MYQTAPDRASQSLVEASAAQGRGSDAWERFRTGCRAFLEASLDPGIQRVALHDAPVVLGWEVWREIAEHHTLGVLEVGLERAIAAGQLSRRPVKPLARLLFGALCEGARMIARSADPRAGLVEVAREIDELLAGLRIQPARNSPVGDRPRRRAAEPSSASSRHQRRGPVIPSS